MQTQVRNNKHKGLLPAADYSLNKVRRGRQRRSFVPGHTRAVSGGQTGVQVPI